MVSYAVKSSFPSKVEKFNGTFAVFAKYLQIAPFRNNEVDKWQRKTQVTIGAAAFRGKLHAFNQKISDQVNAYMRDPSRMIKRMQLRRSSVDIFGKVPEEADNKNEV
uniref:Uncharacterized protein n=1 Tax=Ananas comosus var. bracteatus TaxID=296719 RepID=A0A6V7Q020_ANACO|nr:unnamed protein product [Ananas comosus var. bracteatus]